MVCCGVLPPEAISGLAIVIQFLYVSIEDTSSWAHFLYTTRIGIDVKDYESAMEHLGSRLRTTQPGFGGAGPSSAPELPKICNTRTAQDITQIVGGWMQDCAEGYARI